MRMSRRDFLHLGLVGAGGLALGGLMAGCGHKGEGPLTAPSLGELLSARRGSGDGSGLDVFLGTAERAGAHLVGKLTRHGGAQAESHVTPLSCDIFGDVPADFKRLVRGAFFSLRGVLNVHLFKIQGNILGQPILTA